MNKVERKEYNREYYRTILKNYHSAGKAHRLLEKKYSVPKDKNISRNYCLKRTYGISIEEYNKIFDDQEGLCAICGTHQSNLKRSFAVDHDHLTGKIRGLLCINCNTSLGRFQDSILMLKKAIDYLEKNKI